jgi:hypothetical protein
METWWGWGKEARRIGRGWEEDEKKMERDEKRMGDGLKEGE